MSKHGFEAADKIAVGIDRSVSPIDSNFSPADTKAAYALFRAGAGAGSDVTSKGFPNVEVDFAPSDVKPPVIGATPETRATSPEAKPPLTATAPDTTVFHAAPGVRQGEGVSAVSKFPEVNRENKGDLEVKFPEVNRESKGDLEVDPTRYKVGDFEIDMRLKGDLDRDRDRK